MEITGNSNSNAHRKAQIYEKLEQKMEKVNQINSQVHPLFETCSGERKKKFQHLKKGDRRDRRVRQ